jgi:hypothetical protein
MTGNGCNTNERNEHHNRQCETSQLLSGLTNIKSVPSPENGSQLRPSEASERYLNAGEGSALDTFFLYDGYHTNTGTLPHIEDDAEVPSRKWRCTVFSHPKLWLTKSVTDEE